MPLRQNPFTSIVPGEGGGIQREESEDLEEEEGAGGGDGKAEGSKEGRERREEEL